MMADEWVTPLPQVWLTHRYVLMHNKSLRLKENLLCYQIISCFHNNQNPDTQSPQDRQKLIEDIEDMMIGEHVQQWEVCSNSSHAKPQKPDWLDINSLYKDCFPVIVRFLNIKKEKQKNETFPTLLTNFIEDRYSDSDWKQAWHDHFENVKQTLDQKTIKVYTQVLTTPRRNRDVSTHRDLVASQKIRCNNRSYKSDLCWWC